MITKASPMRYLAAAAGIIFFFGIAGLRFADNFSGDSGRKGGDSESLFLQANYAKGLDAVGDEIGTDGGVLELRIEPDTARFQVQTGEDSAKGFEWDGGDLDSFRVQLVGSGTLDGQAIPVAKLDPGVPERLARGAAQRFGGDIDDVTAMRLSRDIISGDPEWDVWVGSGNGARLYQADLDGGGIRSPGEQR